MPKDPAEGFESVVDYTTVLDNFEGPLDLLLFLIKKEQVRDQRYICFQSDRAVSRLYERPAVYRHRQGERISEYRIRHFGNQSEEPCTCHRRAGRRRRGCRNQPDPRTGRIQTFGRKRAQSSKSWKRSATITRNRIKVWGRPRSSIGISTWKDF